jgi:hypothetical protein
MKATKRILFLVILLAMVFALPSSALANKRLFRASLTTGAELHEVIDSSARGTFIIASFPDGAMRFQLSIRGLSGPASGVHLHGPATASETAPVLLTICGSPAPAAVTSCPFDNGMLVLTGTVDSNLLASWGLRQRDFVAWLADGKIYINAHTELNPAGETRGQLYEP